MGQVTGCKQIQLLQAVDTVADGQTGRLGHSALGDRQGHHLARLSGNDKHAVAFTL